LPPISRGLTTTKSNTTPSSPPPEPITPSWPSPELIGGSSGPPPAARDCASDHDTTTKPVTAFNPWFALAAAVALAYPILVWTGIASIPPAAFVLLGISCIGIRIAGTKQLTRSPAEFFAFLLAAIALVVLLTISPQIAARAYPVAISLATATIFAASLRYPPTIVERIARVTDPNLSPAGIVYTRKVTIVWVGFLLINAAISLWTALWGTLDQWALWNGLLSYLAMGTLFAGEYLIRRLIRP
jgi:uncharacterized membrane protein